VLQPVLLRPKSDGRFHLIAGERRIRAARLAGLKEVPAIVLDVDDIQVLAMALTENIQRSNLNPVEEAMGYRVLRDQFGLTQEEIAQRVGKPRSSIANYLRILQLPDDVRDAVSSGEISMGHARALAGLSAEEDILLCLEKVVRGGLNVRETERLCQEITQGDTKQKPAPAKTKPQEDQLDDDTRALQDRLRERLGSRVRLLMKDKSAGKIEIEFLDLAQLGRILAILGVSLD